MSTSVLNEHDANQGAQSRGEFLGMTGNSGWYLLGSAGATVMMVILLWGLMGVPLLVCVLVGVVLCLLSVAYVFTLKNNKPEHYDTDFFEAALVEAGVVELAFGPRERRPPNPFASRVAEDVQPLESAPRAARPEPERVRGSGMRFQPTTSSAAPVEQRTEGARTSKASRDDVESTVPMAEYDKLRAELMATEEHLEDALAELEER